MTRAKAASSKTRGGLRAKPAVGPVDKSDQPRMRELYQAAMASQGQISGMLEDLGLTARVLGHRLSILRSLGVARTVTLHDPLARGAKHRSTTWVRMASMRPEHIDQFEGDLVADHAVTSAQRVTGGFDYRLSTHHRDWAEAAKWARALRCRPEVAEVEQIAVRHVFGNDLPGLVLHPKA
ncbi:hypothetical protein [Caulobacter soli]|uniref:hypothetical protein n=1 Tax=Caulobacter soli TaxID=2708539 RepID=UPI0013EA37C2|nr:hypothetical protein [Caulobacter soli]